MRSEITATTQRALVQEYFETLSAELEKLRIGHEDDQHFDEQVVKSIESFLPYRNEVIEICSLLARNTNLEETARVVHRFLESLIPYAERPRDVHRWKEEDFDNFKFIVHELFLYSLACFIRDERFEIAASLMSMEYYCPDISHDYGTDMLPFCIFRQYMPSLEARIQRLKLNRLSLRADLLQDRARESGVDFRHLMQADFVLILEGPHGPFK